MQDSIWLDDEYLYKVNKQLKNDIFSAIPSDFSHLEQALFIYNELCKRLNYSLGFYIDQPKYEGYFCNPDNIEKVDGKTNKDVVCFTFDRIFLRLLLERGLIDDFDFWDNVEYNKQLGILIPEHKFMLFKIDGKHYRVDASMGVYKNSDLSQAKFAGHIINGWKYSGASNIDAEKELKLSIQKVCRFNNKISQDIHEYLKEKSQGSDYKHLSLSNRANMFIHMIVQYGHEDEIQAFSFAHKLKHLMFTEQERDDVCDHKNKVAVQYIFNNLKKCATILLHYNLGKEIVSYQIDLTKPEAEVTRTTLDQLYANQRSGTLKYVTASKTIEQVAEPVIKASKSFVKVETI